MTSTIGDYQLVESLGKGALGETFRAQRTFYNKNTGQPMTKDYTIKTLDLAKVSQLGIDPNVLQQEVSNLTNLSKLPDCERYLSCYYDSFTDNGILYVVTDYITGESLQQILLAKIGQPEPNYNRLLDVMGDISHAVEFIHRYGIAHQNIKPSNIIHDVSDDRFKLVDFAFSCSSALNNQCRGKPGTVYYMSPELLALSGDPSQLDFSYRTAHDMWSVGVVFYQMANIGKNYMDFTSNDPQTIAQQIQLLPVKPSENKYQPINSIISVLLDKDPAQRPTAAQLVLLLRQARPGCLIDEINYDRTKAESILTAMGIEVREDIDDYTLCEKLTEQLVKCKVRGNEYTREALIEFAGILGIVAENVPHSKLCKEIQEELEHRAVQYKQHVTDELLRAIDYMAFARIRDQEGLLDDLNKRFGRVYTEAKRNKLIDLNLLEARRQEKNRQYHVYLESASEQAAQTYALQHDAIVELILSIDPHATSEQQPLGELKIIKF